MKAISKAKCKKLQRNRRCRLLWTTDKQAVSKCGKKIIVYNHFSGQCQLAIGKRALRYGYAVRKGV